MQFYADWTQIPKWRIDHICSVLKWILNNWQSENMNWILSSGWLNWTQGWSRQLMLEQNLHIYEIKDQYFHQQREMILLLISDTGLLLHMSNMYFHFRWPQFSMHMSEHPKVLRRWTLDFLFWTWFWKDKEQSLQQQVCDFLVEFVKYFNLYFCTLPHWQLLL